MANILTEYPQFFTATNLEWELLLKTDKYKDIVIESLRFLVQQKRILPLLVFPARSHPTAVVGVRAVG